MPAAAPIPLLPATTTSASGVGASVYGLARYQGLFGVMNCSAVPVGGAPTLDVYIQATPDGGTTWQDVAHYQFTTAVAERLFQLNQMSAGATTSIAPSNGALAANTVVQGPFGDQLQVKYVFSAGGSTGGYTLSVTAQPVGAP